MLSAFQKKFFMCILLVTFILPAFPLEPAIGASQGIERLRKQVEGVINGIKGEVGVVAKHLETGEEFAVNGDVYFPMASVFKVPVLVEVMAQIKEGRFTLDDEISIRKTDQHM
jgi:beta-lactamase class A